VRHSASELKNVQSTLDLRATGVPGNGNLVYGLTQTDACAEPGDSGGSGDCAEGGDTFFQPVQEVLDRYGLTLETN
jgi:hypothetical protein